MCSKINQPASIFTPPTMAEWLNANADNIAYMYVQDCARLEVEAHVRAGTLPPDGSRAQLQFCTAHMESGVPTSRKKTAEKLPSIAPGKRYRALKKSDGRCCLCGRGAAHGVSLEVDHIEPVSVAPDRVNDETNLQVLCSECNSGKGHRDSTDWRGQTR